MSISTAPYPSTKAKQRVYVAAIRKEIDYIRDCLDTVDSMLSTLLGQLHNRPPVMKTAVKSRRLTPNLKAAIIADHIANPHLSQQELAIRHHTNHGRISNALAGIRT